MLVPLGFRVSVRTRLANDGGDRGELVRVAETDGKEYILKHAATVSERI